MAESDSKTVVLTGVTRGLGRALGGALARSGHRVFGCGRDEAALKEVELELGERGRAERVDIGSYDDVAAWAERVIAEAGAPDLVLNNAALINANAPLWEVPVAEFASIIDVNVKGSFHVIRAFLPAMIERGRGVVVNFSSGWGRSTSAEVAPYCASKFAIEGMSAALAQDLPEGLAAVSFNPGIIDTAMLRSSFGALARNYSDPDDWALQNMDKLLALGPADNGRSI